MDYYGMDGCCLTCDDAEPGCLCPECKCRRCSHYMSLPTPEVEESGKIKWGVCTLAGKEETAWEVWLDLEIDKETEKAIHVKKGSYSFWLPKSQVKVREKHGCYDDINVAEWLSVRKAEELGLDPEELFLRMSAITSFSRFFGSKKVFNGTAL